MLEGKEGIINASKVMLAYTEGKTIQSKLANCEDSEWLDAKNPVWNWYDFEYRIKPKTTYKPYAGVHEFTEAKKCHGGELVGLDGSHHTPVMVNRGGVAIIYGNGNIYTYSYERILEKFKWADGSICGIMTDA